MQLSALGQDLYKGEILLTNILQVVFLQSSLDHLGRLILTGQQYALVHVAIVAELHADPDDAGVVHLSVVEGQGGHGERALMAGDQVRVS